MLLDVLLDLLDPLLHISTFLRINRNEARLLRKDYAVGLPSLFEQIHSSISLVIVSFWLITQGVDKLVVPDVDTFIQLTPIIHYSFFGFMRELVF